MDSRGDEITDGLSNTGLEGPVSVSYLSACSQRKVRCTVNHIKLTEFVSPANLECRFTAYLLVQMRIMNEVLEVFLRLFLPHFLVYIRRN